MESLDAIWSSALTTTGFERYEVSNFAQPGHRSRHNQVYWSNRDCLGLGPGAASSLGALRWTNIRDTDSWLGNALGRRSTRAHVERLAPEEKLLETLGSGLRTLEGLSLEELSRRFGPHWVEALEPTLGVLEDSGYLQRGGGRLRIPAESLIRADSVASSLARALGGSDLGAHPSQAAP
jgi:oxygen-independent coproporphyrinogen-3 oxidase